MALTTPRDREAQIKIDAATASEPFQQPISNNPTEVASKYTSVKHVCYLSAYIMYSTFTKNIDQMYKGNP